MNTVTWSELAGIYPEFVNWVIANYAPQLDEPITTEELDDYLANFKTNYEPDVGRITLGS